MLMKRKYVRHFGGSSSLLVDLPKLTPEMVRMNELENVIRGLGEHKLVRAGNGIQRLAIRRGAEAGIFDTRSLSEIDFVARRINRLARSYCL